MHTTPNSGKGPAQFRQIVARTNRRPAGSEHAQLLRGVASGKINPRTIPDLKVRLYTVSSVFIGDAWGLVRQRGEPMRIASAEQLQAGVTTACENLVADIRREVEEYVAPFSGAQLRQVFSEACEKKLGDLGDLAVAQMERDLDGALQQALSAASRQDLRTVYQETLAACRERFKERYSESVPGLTMESPSDHILRGLLFSSRLLYLHLPRLALGFRMERGGFSRQRSYSTFLEENLPTDAATESALLTEILARLDGLYGLLPGWATMSIEAGNDFGFQLEPSYRPEPNGGFSFVPGVEEILANMPNAMASDQPQIGCPALWAESAAGEPVILEHLRLSRQFTADVLFPTTIRLGRMLAERYDLKNYSL